MDKRVVYLHASHVENMANTRFRRCRIGKVRLKQVAWPSPVVYPVRSVTGLDKWDAENPATIVWWDRITCASDLGKPPIIPPHGCLM